MLINHSVPVPVVQGLQWTLSEEYGVQEERGDGLLKWIYSVTPPRGKKWGLGGGRKRSLPYRSRTSSTDDSPNVRPSNRVGMSLDREGSTVEAVITHADTGGFSTVQDWKPWILTLE